MRRTKIIATYGPSLASPEVLSEAMKQVDVLRINFSHKDEKSWERIKPAVLKAIADSGRDVKLLADLCGPKVRLGPLEKDMPVTKGDEVFFEYDPDPRSGSIPVNYDGLCRDAKAGAVIIIGDGEPRFVVEGVEQNRIRCTALSTGEVKSKKGIWLSGAQINIQNPTDTDTRIAKFVKSEGFDYLALSFVVAADQIERLKSAAPGMPVIAKIEQGKGVANIDAIAKVSDIIMVARGDLGLDMPLERVPWAQRRIIEGAKRNGRPFVIATQALISMLNSTIPTRAEVNDIANGVLSGADYLMLSEETAAGKYPLEAIALLGRVITETEKG